MVGPFLKDFIHRLEILNHLYNKIQSSSGKQYLIACQRIWATNTKARPGLYSSITATRGNGLLQSSNNRISSPDVFEYKECILLMVRSIEKSWFGLLSLDFRIFLHSTEAQNRLRNYTDLYIKILMGERFWGSKSVKSVKSKSQFVYRNHTKTSFIWSKLPRNLRRWKLTYSDSWNYSSIVIINCS